MSNVVRLIVPEAFVIKKEQLKCLILNVEDTTALGTISNNVGVNNL